MLYSGAAPRGAVIDQVATLIGRVDPFVRSVLVRTPPYAELFSANATVRVVGAGAANGRAYDILAVDSPRFRASLFVDQARHLPLSVEGNALDGTGRTVSTIRRTLEWSSVGVSLSPSTFTLRRRAALGLWRFRRGTEPLLGHDLGEQKAVLVDHPLRREHLGERMADEVLRVHPRHLAAVAREEPAPWRRRRGAARGRGRRPRGCPPRCMWPSTTWRVSKPVFFSTNALIVSARAAPSATTRIDERLPFLAASRRLSQMSKIE